MNEAQRIGFSRRKREENNTLGESWGKSSGIRLRTFNGSNNSGAGISLDLFSGSRGGRGQGRDRVGTPGRRPPSQTGGSWHHQCGSRKLEEDG